MRFLLAAILMSGSMAQAQSYVIEDIVTQKGYILSIDLQNKQCPKIWSKQIPEFMKNNPNSNSQ